MSSKSTAASFAAATLAIFACPLAALAQDQYPSRYVRVITTTGTGTGPDIVIRYLAEQLSREWGQQVIVENNSTGGGLVAAQQANSAPPDGYTLLSASASAFTVLPIRQERAPTTIGQHLKPIGFLGQLPMVYAVSPKLGVKTIKELVELSKKEPQRIFYGASAAGALPHMSGEYFKQKSGAQLTFVPFRGTADALNALMSGQLSMMVENYPSLEGQIQSGGLVQLAFASEKRLPNFPDMPTVAETYPGFVAVGWAALAAPAGVPDVIVEKINADMRRIFKKPDVEKRMIDLGNYTIDMSTAELTSFIKREQEQWGPIVRSIVTPPAGAAKQ